MVEAVHASLTSVTLADAATAAVYMHPEGVSALPKQASFFESTVGDARAAAAVSNAVQVASVAGVAGATPVTHFG
jgi:hypothetical protein